MHVPIGAFATYSCVTLCALLMCLFLEFFCLLILLISTLTPKVLRIQLSIGHEEGDGRGKEEMKVNWWGLFKITFLLISVMHGCLSHSTLLKAPHNKSQGPRIMAKCPPRAIFFSQQFKGFSKMLRKGFSNKIFNI